jgi:hypothetical protein
LESADSHASGGVTTGTPRCIGRVEHS